MTNRVSVVVCSYNMRRELPRTIRSLSPAMQRGVDKSNYEVIVVDNGSTVPFDENECRQWDADLRLCKIAPGTASPSPARALNDGIAQARGGLIGAMIDGARLASPGIVGFAAMADRLVERAVIVTLGFHLGPEVQMASVLKGYDQEREDALLAKARWTEDGYRLFDISVFAGSSEKGWFSPVNESNAIFMRKALWDELGGFDEKFASAGGGLVNLDLLARAVALPQVNVITLLGEGTFHQIHGGVATNSSRDNWDTLHAEYVAIRGHALPKPIYRSLYVGSVPNSALPSIGRSAQLALALHEPKASVAAGMLGWRAAWNRLRN